MVNFFSHFDEAYDLGEFPNRHPLRLLSVRIDGVPVEDLPCIDVWNADSVKVQDRGGGARGRQGRCCHASRGGGRRDRGVDEDGTAGNPLRTAPKKPSHAD